MDTIFYNGNIRTMDKAIPSAQAVAVKHGIITRVGTDDQVLKLKTANTKLVDLKGELMLPGFNDSHLHLLSYGYSLEKVDLGNAKSINELIERGKTFLAQHGELKWLQGRGWNNDNWEGGAFPTRFDLDKITTDIPMSYTRTCGHIIITNTKALEVMGITEETPQVEGGRFDVDENGKPLGIFREAARNFVYDAIPSLSVEDIKRMIVCGGKDALRYGITSMQTDDFEAVAEAEYKNVIQAYSELSTSGQMPVRVYEQCLLPPISRLKEFISLGYKTGQGNDMFKIGPLKLLADGSLGARTAFLTQPYADDSGTRGIAVFTQEEIDELVATAHDNGMTVAIHCIGDGTMRMAFSAIEKAITHNPQTNMRHSLIHCQITDMELLEKFRDLNIIAHIQPIFIDYDMHIVKKRVGEKMEATSYNWKTMLNMGVHVALGTDCPVEGFNPLANIYCAVTRQDKKGFPENGWLPQQKITVDEAVYAYTMGSAYASYDESAKGSITIGKLADFAVLKKDIFDIDVHEIKDVTVDMTVLNGDIVYRAIK